VRLAALLLLLPGLAAARPADFGKQWVRTHPFTLLGLNQWAKNLDLTEYKAAGFTELMAWEEPALQGAKAQAGGLPFHAHVRPADQGATAAFKSLAQATVAAGPTTVHGWLLHDEPGRLQMPGIGQAAAWLKTIYPALLVYGNAFPSYASPTQLYGDSSRPGYSFSQYLDDFITFIDPDLLMWDFYPFTADGKTSDTFFSDLMLVRSKALAKKIPYWAWVQSWANANMRLPSESDLRMQVFSFLTAGYTGLAYFTYDHFESGGLLDAAGNPTALYGTVAALNLEVSRLGAHLRSLTSTGVRFVPGKFQLIVVLPNTPPAGLTSWSATSADPKIKSVTVDNSSPSSYGTMKNGLIGLLQDDAGQRYFMLTNLSHAAGATSASMSLPFFVDFDSAVNSLVVIDNKTGAVSTVPLSNHRLSVTLPGGTGRLYTYAKPAPPVDGGPSDGPVVVGDGPRREAGVSDGPRRDATGGGELGTGDWTPGHEGVIDDGGCGCGVGHAGHATGLAGLLLLVAFACGRRAR